MPRSITVMQLLLLCTLLCVPSPRVLAQEQGPMPNPWFIIVDHLLLPESVSEPEQFLRGVVDELTRQFQQTPFQPILLDKQQTVGSITNNKRDIIIHSDPNDFAITDPFFADTLVIWLRYETGFTYEKIEEPLVKKSSYSNGVEVAKSLNRCIEEHFIGTVMVFGTPEESLVEIVKGLSLPVPFECFVPAGQYTFSMSYPGFKTREFSVDVFPGNITRKRIRLLPASSP